MQKITPFLWFNDEAEEAAKFYVSLFPHSKIRHVARYGDGAPGKKGSVMTVAFTLDGLDITALNGGPVYELNESFSLVVPCKDQRAIDRYWKALTAHGGKESQCGWLKDRFGLSWQIIPENIADLISNEAGMKAMLGMKKLDIAALERASGKANGNGNARRRRERRISPR